MEKRKNLYDELNLCEGRETALLIDTYKYLDLMPCNNIELKSMGYLDLSLIQKLMQNSNLPLNVSLQLINQELNSQTNISTGVTVSSTSSRGSGSISITNGHHQQANNDNSKITDNKSKFLTPDSSQMLPFKPLRNPHSTPSIPTLIPPLLSPNGIHQGSNLFAFPTMIIDFIKRLPPPYCFNVKFIFI
jgi:hypothetical protein